MTKCLGRCISPIAIWQLFGSGVSSSDLHVVVSVIYFHVLTDLTFSLPFPHALLSNQQQGVFVLSFWTATVCLIRLIGLDWPCVQIWSTVDHILLLVPNFQLKSEQVTPEMANYGSGSASESLFFDNLWAFLFSKKSKWKLYPVGSKSYIESFQSPKL